MTAADWCDDARRGPESGGVCTRRSLLRRGLGIAAGTWAASVLRVGGVTRLAPARALSEAPSPGGPGSGNVCMLWNNAALEAIRRTRPGPPMVARQLAILNTCMFDAWAAYHYRAVGTRLGGKLRRPPEERTAANKAQAVSFAAYRALEDLFPPTGFLPTTLPPYVAAMTALGYDPADVTLNPSTPAGVGNTAATAVLSFRHDDGSNQLGNLTPSGVPYADWTGYQPANLADATLAGGPNFIDDPDRWQPLVVPDGRGGYEVQRFVGPHWSQVTPFALSAFEEFAPPAPPAQHMKDAYRISAQEVLDYSAGLTDRQKTIAEYWADGAGSELPPGHWNLFAQFVSQRDGNGLDDDVPLFFALGNAGLDASIACWGAKRVYDYVRPVTAIRYLFSGTPVTAWAGPGKGTRTFDGAKWWPYIVTPPFAEFYSGHSTFSGAAAEVLRRATGSDSFGASVTIPAGSSRVEPGQTPAGNVTLAWATFSEAADQAGISRRYGGIHFSQGDLTGRAIGRQIAGRVWERTQAYLEGSA